MDMLEYKKMTGLTFKKIASDLGIGGINPASTLQRYAIGRSVPRTDILLKIPEITKGHVTIEEVLLRHLCYKKGLKDGKQN